MANSSGQVPVDLLGKCVWSHSLIVNYDKINRSDLCSVRNRKGSFESRRSHINPDAELATICTHKLGENLGLAQRHGEAGTCLGNKNNLISNPKHPKWHLFGQRLMNLCFTGLIHSFALKSTWENRKVFCPDLTSNWVSCPWLSVWMSLTMFHTGPSARISIPTQPKTVRSRLSSNNELQTFLRFFTLLWDLLGENLLQLNQ